MRLALLLCLVPANTMAFAPMVQPTAFRRTTKLEMVSRRDAFLAGAAALAGMAVPQAVLAQQGVGSRQDEFAHPSVNSLSIITPEVNYEPSQQATSGKVDVNNAAVGEYKQFPGFFPTAAGKIASNGPYETVQDIYKIPGLTANDKKVFKKYESELTALPPGRMFDERINARVST